MSERKRIIVVGGGIAGLEVATLLGRRLGRKGIAKLTLVDSDTAHVWKPMLHTIAAGTNDLHREQIPFASHAVQHGFSYWPGDLQGLSQQKKSIRLAPLRRKDGSILLESRELTYDILVLSIGSRANDFGTPGTERYCHFIDSRRQADSFNQDARALLFKCVSEATSTRIAIVGGGATGVELAAELVQLMESAKAYGIHDLSSRIRLTLIESGPRILAAFPEKISSAAERQLHSLGVNICTNTTVAAAEAEGYRLNDGSLIEAGLMVWAAGVKGHNVSSTLEGLQLNRNNQIVIHPTLQAVGSDHIFALGDCASLTLPDNAKPLPPTAQVAHQQAQHLARHLPAWLDGTPIPAFSYRDFGAVVSLGRYNAFGSLGKFGFFPGGFVRGRFAQISHVMLYRSHQVRLHGFRRGSLFWLSSLIDRMVRPPIRVD